MVNHDDGNSVLIQILYNIENLFTSQRIKLCRTFVQYEDLGLHDKGGTESYSLYLTTGQLQGIFVNDVIDSHQFGYGIYLFDHFFSWDTAVAQTICQFLSYGTCRIGQLVEGILEYQTDLCGQISDRAVFHYASVDCHAAGHLTYEIVRNQSYQCVAQGGFTGSVGADDTEKAAFLHLETYIFQCFMLRLAIFKTKIFYIYYYSTHHVTAFK